MGRGGSAGQREREREREWRIAQVRACARNACGAARMKGEFKYKPSRPQLEDTEQHELLWRETDRERERGIDRQRQSKRGSSYSSNRTLIRAI